jgi:hypothetical protein
LKPVIFKLPNHSADKNYLLSTISESKTSTSRISEIENIDNTDFSIKEDKKYFNYFWDKNSAFIANIIRYSINYDGLWALSDDPWFQQYVSGNNHDWHFHKNSFWNFVYFLEMPDDGPSTEFKEPFTGNIFSLKIEEGDLLVFPSQYIHRSPFNTSKERKTIIAFNITYEYSNE